MSCVDSTLLSPSLQSPMVPRPKRSWWRTLGTRQWYALCCIVVTHSCIYDEVTLVLIESCDLVPNIRSRCCIRHQLTTLLCVRNWHPSLTHTGFLGELYEWLNSLSRYSCAGKLSKEDGMHSLPARMLFVSAWCHEKEKQPAMQISWLPCWPIHLCAYAGQCVHVSMLLSG